MQINGKTRLMVLKSYKLQLSVLGYYIESGAVRSQQDLHKLINTWINKKGSIKPTTKRPRLIALDRCYLAFNSDFAQWSTLKSYYSEAIKLRNLQRKNNKLRLNKCVHTAIFIKLLLRLES